MQRYKKWDLLNKNNPTNLEDLLEILLINRNLKLEKDKKYFLSPPNINLIEYKDVGIDEKEINKALKRLDKAKKEKQKIIVYGDYDVDGICATAIMWETLHKADFNVMPFIPNRFTDGYGLNPDSINNLKEENKDLKLIITVDNGIVAHDALKNAKKLKIDVIITDHHQKDDKKLIAKAIIHSTKVSGSAVSYFLAKEIAKKYDVEIKNHIELVALGTIADQMPLIAENRFFVWHGLKSLKKTSRLGLKKLIKISDINLGDEINTYEVNFKIAPRINAAGRVESGMEALRLLCTTNETRATQLAEKINDLNFQRQKIVEEVLKKATSGLAKKQDVVVVSGEDLHEGVIGLAASKLVDTFYRPSIVLSIKGDIAKASARSIQGFDIISAIRELDDLIIQGGGHKMAAGFSMETKNIEEFISKINEKNKQKLKGDILISKLKIDSQLDFNLINWDLFEILEKFKPFGIANFNPVFVATNLEASDVKTVGQNDKHLKFSVVSTSGEKFDAIAFNFGRVEDFIRDRKINIAFQIDKNEWNGRKTLQLKVKDINLANGDSID